MDTCVFLINLDKSVDRLQSCHAQLEAAGIDYERVSAVYGVELSRHEIETYYPESERKKYYKELGLGELGCYVSHRIVWQMIVDRELDHTIVLEDDFKMNPDFQEVVNTVAKLPPNWDYIKLAERSKKRRVIWREPRGKFELVRYRKVPTCTSAQAVSRRGAIKLLRASESFGRPIDVDLQYWWEKGVDVSGLRPYKVAPIETGTSEIDLIAKRKSSKKRPVRKFQQQLSFSIRNGLENRKLLRQIQAALPLKEAKTC